MIKVRRRIKHRHYSVKLEVVKIDTVEYTVGDEFRRDLRFWTGDGQVLDVACFGFEKNSVVIRTQFPEREWVVPKVYKG